MIEIRSAEESDVDRIREIFLATYGRDYAHPEYYDSHTLKRMVFDDDTLLLVAEDAESGDVVGTASVVLEVGSHDDLVGEFGRLAVHPDARKRGIGRKLMEARLERVRERLHLGIVDNRVAHPYSQKISIQHGFVPVGFLPLKLLLEKRESVALFVQHFGDSLQLRRNNPRVIPEALRLAKLALGQCGLPCDAIVDDESSPYPYEEFRLEELTTEGYATLLRFERGRIGHREIFGPMRLHYGLFKLRARHSNYLLAYRDDEVAGAVGLTIDPVEKAARIFELVSADESPVRFLLESVAGRCEQDGVEYIEVDVGAHSPRMQRTLVELNYLPAAYVPAMVFHKVERLDTIRMVRLLVRPELGDADLVPEAQAIADAVLRSFATRNVLPKIEMAIPSIALFEGLSEEQAKRLAALCDVHEFAPGEVLLVEGDNEGKTFVILEGEVQVTAGDPPQPVGTVKPGESLGEMALLSGLPHSATATATTQVQAAALDHHRLRELVRQRPDIAVVVYRNFSNDIGAKLRRAVEKLSRD
jgi:GNAT superfamily N-acetyltransferase